MRRLHGLDQVRKDMASVLTVGTFDGVHLGHQAILRYLLERAGALGGTSTVLSFHPHPREIVEGAPLSLLTTIEERADIMEEIGLDQLVVLPFTKEFSRLSAEAFVEDILVRGIGLREIVIGYDHAFGRDRRGNADLLRTLGKKHGFTVDIVPARIIQEQAVSSRKIRRVLEEDGGVEAAAEHAGAPILPYGPRRSRRRAWAGNGVPDGEHCCGASAKGDTRRWSVRRTSVSIVKRSGCISRKPLSAWHDEYRNSSYVWR